jgi:hypothetical protein
VKYVLLRARDFMSPTEDGAELAKDSPVAQQLLTNREPPPSFELRQTVMLQAGPDAKNAGIFARLYKTRRSEGGSPVSINPPSAAVAVAVAVGSDSTAGNVQ